MSREFDAAMLAVAARALLETGVPLTREEIFPSFEYGKVLSKSLQTNMMDKMLREGVILESKKNGVVRYTPHNFRDLEWTARMSPPNIGYDLSTLEEDMKFTGKEGDKRARIHVAMRALKRLLASEESPTSDNHQSRTSLFIAKKGDRFQQRQVLEETWQRNFLDSLERIGVISSDPQSKTKLYAIANKTLVQDIVENRTDMCIHSLLFPDEKCQFGHAKPTTDDSLKAESDLLKEESKIIDLEEKKIVLEKQLIEEAHKVIEANTSSKVAEVSEAFIPAKVESEISNQSLRDAFNEAVAEGGPEAVEGISGSLYDKIISLVDSQIVIIKTQSEHIEKISKIMNAQMEVNQKLLQNLGSDVTHVHSKLDKIHRDQESLKSEVQEIAKVAETTSSENSLGSIRKKISDIEKLVTNQGASIDSGNRLIKTGLSEAAMAMVDAAAKAFINSDRSEILQRMEIMEDGITSIKGHVDIVLDEVQKTLEKLRQEAKSQSRMPVIADRMNAIIKELNIISASLPDVPKS